MSRPYIQIKSPKGLLDNKYQGKDILVVGAGPTTNLVSWENLEYDYIFSCNQYYQCKKLTDKRVELVSLINRVLTSMPKQLEQRIVKDDSIIAIEPYHSKNVFWHPNYQNFIKRNKEKVIYFDTALQNKSGAAPRLATLAASFKPKNLYIVGIDGYDLSKAKTTQHSFEPGLKGQRDRVSIEEVNKSHHKYAEFLGALCKEADINLFNLGEGLSENSISKVSENNYPLPDNIKKLLL